MASFENDCNKKNLHLSVAPQWALASYSCVMGKSKKITENEDVPWRLQVGTTVNETIQVPIVRIYKYPQVSKRYNKCATVVVGAVLTFPQHCLTG